MRATAALAGLRGQVRAHFPDTVKQQGEDLVLLETADVLREQAVRDGAGGTKLYWNTIETDVPARLDPVGGSGEATAPAGQTQETPTHAVRLAAGTQVANGDRVTIQDRTWSVIGCQRRTEDVTVLALVREAPGEQA